MSYLNKKSADNLVASSLLIDNKLYASSVHCSYYAMLQYMTCKLSVCQNIGFETITLNSKGPGSHNYVIDSTFNHIKASIQNLEPLMKIVEITNIQKLRTKISDLKLLRVQSDYQNLEIDEELSDKALIFSQEIISKLNTFIP